jgi:hypothetical protein
MAELSISRRAVGEVLPWYNVHSPSSCDTVAHRHKILPLTAPCGHRACTVPRVARLAAIRLTMVVAKLNALGVSNEDPGA